MSREPLRRRRFTLLLSLACMPGFGCAGQGTPHPSADEPQPPPDSAQRPHLSQTPGSVRFAIQIGREAVAPIYVLLNEEDDQPGWVRLFRNDERIYLRERCEIPDCGVTPAVCGAAIPLVRNIKGDGSLSSVEFVWDGMTSVIDPRTGCETRQSADPGEYVARFCYSRTAEFEPGGDTSRAAPGSLVDAACTEIPFTLQQTEVVLRIPPEPF